VGAVNKYIVEEEPWLVAEQEGEEKKSRLATILYTACEALRIVTALAHPVLPDATAKIWHQLGLGDIAKFDLSDLKWGQLPLGGKLGKVEPVFPRADKSLVERMQQMEQERSPQAPDVQSAAVVAAPSAIPAGTGAHAGQPATQAAHGPTDGSPPPKGAPAPADGKITIDDFLKVEMRVGQVRHAEKVKGADKLLRLEVDIGTEVRQVVAGIAISYAPEALIGRKVVIVANLAPRKLRGLESNGMIVAASFGEEGKPVLASFLEDVPVGSKLK
jgi:methionyl-tRNA synthetase